MGNEILSHCLSAGIHIQELGEEVEPPDSGHRARSRGPIAGAKIDRPHCGVPLRSVRGANDVNETRRSRLADPVSDA